MALSWEIEASAFEDWFGVMVTKAKMIELNEMSGFPQPVEVSCLVVMTLDKRRQLGRSD